ncbi:MAG: TetR/AcrR family transcriptional regulator [Coxiellaceae bacterium]|nr:MAG: TetR/AcrR family transcriptional regulator [Coxiellaceae bacterium]
MAKKLIQRKSADKTRTTILKAARKLFAKAGFSATSTQAIAKAAQVNENLIFHHFSNKAELWRKVKESIVEELAIEPLDKQPESFQDFLTAAVRQRLSAFQQHPDLVRLLRWQAMESKREQLIAGNILAPKNWLEPICYLQKMARLSQRSSRNYWWFGWPLA